jgi:glycosyltransferase involved in cell wall biosynthesis
MRVCLLHNYRERQQMSMKLYAEKLGDALMGQGVEVKRVRVPDLLPESWQSVPGMSKLDSYVGRFGLYPLVARRQRADVFHIVDHGQAYLVAHLDPGRTVVTCHDVILLALAAGRLRGPRAPRVATQVLRYAVSHLRRARWLIADSDHTRRDLVSLVGLDPDRVEVVYPGLNARFRHAPELRDEVRRRLGLGDSPVVLHVGQAGFYKNLEGCLRVIARLRRDGLDVTFVRVGQPLRPAQVQLAKKLGLEDSVRQLGALGADDLVALYNAADVLLFPSLYEGFGWPPLEAMACGTPVVCSAAGSLAEVVGNAALITDADDDQGLTARITAVLTEPLLAADLRERGLRQVQAYDWDRAAQRVHHVYERVIDG